jgi:hypothetical protein
MVSTMLDGMETPYIQLNEYIVSQQYRTAEDAIWELARSIVLEMLKLYYSTTITYRNIDTTNGT